MEAWAEWKKLDKTQKTWKAKNNLFACLSKTEKDRIDCADEG